VKTGFRLSKSLENGIIETVQKMEKRMAYYNHKEIEKKIYDLWIKEKLFHSEIENGKKPFVIPYH